MLRCLDRFQDRVFLEGGTGFLDRRQFRRVRQIANLKSVAENLGEFPGLVGVARSKKETMHVDRIYRINWIRIQQRRLHEPQSF